MRLPMTLLCCAGLLAVAGCGSRSDTSFKPAVGKPAVAHARTSTSEIIVTENDIVDRPYRTIGDIEVTVMKWTIFDKDPTRDAVAQAMREKAAQLGADAVILARYGTVGIGFASWGQMDGNGRAIAFQ